MKTTTEVNEYEQQAIDFLTKTGTELSVAFVRYGKHFDDDKDSRDIYNVTLKRGSREFTFKFGQSINCSMEWEAKSIYAKNHWSNAGKPRLIGETMIEALRCIGSYPVGGGFTNKDFVRNANFSAPNANNRNVVKQLQTRFHVPTIQARVYHSPCLLVRAATLRAQSFT